MPGTFTIKAASDNIRATPVMAPKNVQLCVDNSVTKWDRDLVMYHEMGARSLAALLLGHPGWAAVQGPAGDRGRSAIAYRTDTYALVESHTVQLSHADLGPVHVPSGNRWALVAMFRHRATGIVFAAIAYHSVAHINVGAHYGYTGGGSKAIEDLKGTMENPGIAVYKEGMAALEQLIDSLHATFLLVLVGGDWNFDALADMRAAATGKNEPTAPYATMERAGIQTIYSTKKLTEGTDGTRGIDYLGVSKPFGLYDTAILSASAEANLPTDHDFVAADVSVTMTTVAPPPPPVVEPPVVVKPPAPVPAPAKPVVPAPPKPPVVKPPAPQAKNRVERADVELHLALSLLNAAIVDGRKGAVLDARNALIGVINKLPAK